MGVNNFTIITPPFCQELKESGSGADTPDLQEQEYTDEQPGNDMPQMQPPHMGGGGMPFAAAAAEIPQLQGKIAEMMMLLQNPLPPAVSMQLQMQLEALNVRLQQAQMMVMYNGGGMGMGMGMGPGVGVGVGVGMGMNPMMGPMGGGMQGPPPPMGIEDPFNKAEYRPSWTNPFPNQQPAGGESAYQRLPVNKRRKGPKRDRPSDFLEINGDGGQPKVARYWE